ncbi:MAG: CCA tRNA nucleotidyltransferase [Verrucomicrobia bacterium]|jgi:poly(A) polymerase|nr:CCA tRNA nucleotidyltransferase [Verrucomicrobiota bacterium]
MSVQNQPDTAAPEVQREAATAAVQRLQQAGYTSYLAGGCVRDRLLGIEPLDYDIATEAHPDQVLALFPGATAVGKSFGVVVTPWPPWTFEIATFRQDHDYQDGRHPSHVSFVTAEEDATRRDFTINAMFYDPIADTLHDFIGGEEDLNRGIIRCVGDADQRFKEDHLRMLRAIRFAARFGFKIESRTEQAIRRTAEKVASISPERIQSELTRLLMEAQHPGQAVLMLESLGVLPVILPEVAALREQEQPPEFHPEGDVLTHTVIMLDAMRTRDATLAYATLFHDLGKPQTATHDGDRIRFNCHAERGAEMAESILTRLRFPTKLTDAVKHCVRNHMHFIDVQKMRKATLRRLMGAPTFDTELELQRLDCVASHGLLDNYAFLKAARAEMANEPILPPRWVTGRDLLNAGVPEGRTIGKWLRIAYDAQLEGRFENQRDLLEWVKQQIDRS